jgi:hypothetical protein
VLSAVLHLLRTGNKPEAKHEACCNWQQHHITLICFMLVIRLRSVLSLPRPIATYSAPTPLLTLLLLLLLLLPASVMESASINSVVSVHLALAAVKHLAASS